MPLAIKGRNKGVMTMSARSGSYNGQILELYKEGPNTSVYLNIIMPNGFKGYHLHRKKGANYVCIKGQIVVSLYVPGSTTREEHYLEFGNTLHIPKGIATGLMNISPHNDAWLVNYPDIPYDPTDKDEQVEYSLEELESGVIHP